MADLSIVRHQSVFDPVKHEMPSTIIGLGATGSRVFAALVELGCVKIAGYDFDTVEAHNLANQIYSYNHVGDLKSDACTYWYVDKIGRAPPDSIAFRELRVPHEDAPVKGVVFLLTDTMASRREIFDACLGGNYDVSLVIETRMASTYGNVFVFDPCNPVQCERWLDTLIPDDEAEVSACGTSISVGVTASLIANLAVWRYIQFCKRPDETPAFRTNTFFDPLFIISEET